MPEVSSLWQQLPAELSSCGQGLDYRKSTECKPLSDVNKAVMVRFNSGSFYNHPGREAQ